ncbi:hypothetical protein OHA37_00015 [Streptomyces sp. NBC_00335]|uniref:hypothetical protein n=1 Tax=unclassified Streptomyces TaxID=2593676 RepID=UPI00224D6654|nr:MULTISPECIES: hypothetical protein [unclassified Streptomyces]MCX5410156.1 hypothetical protein [Streptomyces sp. NBC_00086]
MMEIPGYEGRPLVHRPGLLDEPLFWPGHLYSCAHDEDTEELLFGADYDAAEEFHRELIEQAQWPVFTIPLTGGHLLHVVYRAWKDDPGVDYVLHHSSWERALLLATDDGHFMGPALSWTELLYAADNQLPGGSSADPDSRLLLLLPALGDDRTPESAAPRLAAALTALTVVEDPEALATALADGQGAAGPSRWKSKNGVRGDNGAHSYRNPSNAFALPPEDLARISSAFHT